MGVVTWRLDCFIPAESTSDLCRIIWLSGLRTTASFFYDEKTHCKIVLKKYVCCVVITQTKLLMEFRVIMAVCCDNKWNIQVRTVVKMQSFDLKASGTQVYHFALSIYTAKWISSSSAGVWKGKTSKFVTVVTLYNLTVMWPCIVTNFL
jgi:hypothetical protein